MRATIADTEARRRTATPNRDAEGYAARGVTRDHQQQKRGGAG